MKTIAQGIVLSFVLVSSAKALAQSAPPLTPPSQAASAPPSEMAPPPPALQAVPIPPPPPPPPPPAPSDDWKFALHGLVGVSLYMQDTPAYVLNGQGPLLPLTQPGGGLTTGADIRQSRFNFSVSGPRVLGGAVPKAVLEIDLFGLNSPGGYGEVSVYSRVRLAYADLNWGNDVLRFGQDHQLIFALIPESIGHMAFPATYFNGLIGWREPGLGYFHTFQLGDESKLEVAAQAIKSDWQNPTDFGNSTVNDLNVDLGQLSGWLGAEGRVKLTVPHFMAFVAGHYNHVEGTHAGDLVAPPTPIPGRDWDVIAGVAGFKASFSGVTILGSAYAGKNLGPLLGDLLQFPTTNDVSEWGGWLQIGYNFTDHLNAYVIGGTSRPSEGDMVAAGGGRVENQMVGGMIRYQDGGFAVGPEFFHSNAKDVDGKDHAVAAGTGAPNGVINANQFMLSGVYFF